MMAALLSFETATVADTETVAALRAAVATDLTRRHGPGHWSSIATESSVIRDIKTATVLLARRHGVAVGTVRLATRKPWSIDPVYFTAADNVVYLTDMAVAPDVQRQGIGRSCLEHACAIAAALPADVIRLDAYDAPAGAGPFYAKCGFREVARVTYRKTGLVYFELILKPVRSSA